MQAAVLVFLIWISTALYEDRAFAWFFLVSTLTYATIFWWAVLRFGRFDARVLFVAVSGLYPFTPVIDIAVLGNLDTFNERNSGFVLLLSLSFLASFYIFSTGMLFSERKKRSSNDLLAKIDFQILIAAQAVAFVIYCVLVQLSIGFFHNYTRGEIYQLDTAALAAMRIVMQVGMLLMIAAARPSYLAANGASIEFTKELFRKAGGTLPALLAIAIPLAYYAIDLVVLGDRRFLVTFVLSGLAILAPRRVPLLIIIIGLTAIPALLLFGILRDNPVDNWPEVLLRGDLLRPFNPANLEFAYFSRIADRILASAPADDHPTYSQSLLSILPRILYDDRPLGFGEWFVKTYYPDYWASGGGFAANLIIEAMLNWGLTGPAILGALMGLFFAVVLQISGRDRFTHGLLVFAVLFAMRFDMVTMLKTCILEASIASAWIAACSGPLRAKRVTPNSLSFLLPNKRRKSLRKIPPLS